MKFKQYFAKHGLKVVIAAAIVVVAVVVGANVRAGLAGPVENGASAMAMPVQKAATAIAGWMQGIYGYLYKYDQLVQENSDLKAQVSQLQDQAREYSEVSEENARLRELLNLQDKHADFVFESSKIVSWDASNYTSAVTISKGSDSGIEVGDSVVTEYGALVGQVSELGANWATVRTVVDVSTNVGALAGDNGYAGIITGDFQLMQQGETKLSYLAYGAQIYEGDEITTSGKGGAFPAGLLIGTVSAVMSEAGGQTVYGVVKPACDLGSLSQVFVIKDFDITE